MEMKEKLKQKIKIKAKACNDEVYSLLDFLSENKYFGEVTLFFQNGNVEFIHQKTRLSKSDIKRFTRKTEIQKSNSKNITNVKQTESQLILPLFIQKNKVEVIK